MVIEPSEDRGSRLLRIVEGIAIPPEDARAILIDIRIIHPHLPECLVGSLGVP